MAGGLFNKKPLGKSGEEGKSITGNVVKKAKPVAKAYMDSKDVKQGGGNPLASSSGGGFDGKKKAPNSSFSNSELYHKKNSFAKNRDIPKYKEGANFITSAKVKVKNK